MDFATVKLRDGTELRAPMRVPVSCGKGVGQVGYQVFLQEKTSGIQLHMEAVNRATKLFFEDVETVLHPFGGLGMAAQCMEVTLGRSLAHEFWERDAECCKALRELYPKSEIARVTDSFELILAKAPQAIQGYDVVYLDPTAMTAKKEHLWDVYKKLADVSTTYIWFVDSAISKWWLHTKTYTEFFGEQVAGMDTYFKAYDTKLRTLGLQIIDLCREGTVVYGVVSALQATPEYPLPIVDLRAGAAVI